MTSTFVVHGVTLALAWYCAVNTAASLAAALAARSTRIDGAPARWLALRALPAALASAFVLGVFVPSYWRFEPRGTTEGFDGTLSVLAAGALVAVAAGAVRGAAAWWRAARRTRAWMRTARPLTLASAPVPAFEVDADAPILALAGVLRPRLLVTRGLIAALTADELAASVAHELGHARSRDNLKRLLMRAAPDVLALTPFAAAIERRWIASAEHSADAGVAGDASERCALASALVKVARLMPAPLPLAEPISTLIGGGDITARVHRLLSDAAPEPASRRRPRARLLAVAAAASIAAVYGPMLHAVHELTEQLIRTLP